MQERLDKVRALLDRQQLDGVLVNLEANVAWLLGGRYHINLATDAACVTLWITRQAVAALVNNIEADRLVAEEGLICDEVRVYPWYDDGARQAVLREWTSGKRYADDAALAKEFSALRLQLDATQTEQLRQLGRLAAEAVEAAARACRPDHREYEVAGRLAQECWARGVEPIVNLAAGQRRASLYRHVLPTEERIGSYAILSVSGRRFGLVVSATRMVHFGPVPDELRNKHRAVTGIDARLIAQSRPGVRLKELFETAVAAYRDAGYPEEWTLHHQGGLAGYLSREVRATAQSDVVLVPGHAVAWNPTIRGVKSEDTLLVTADGPQVVTETGDYPTVEITVDGQAVRRPDMLVLEP